MTTGVTDKFVLAKRGESKGRVNDPPVINNSSAINCERGDSPKTDRQRKDFQASSAVFDHGKERESEMMMQFFST